MRSEYIDYHGSYGPAVLGHNHPTIRAAIEETLNSEGVIFTTPHPKEVELTRLFSELVPCGVYGYYLVLEAAKNLASSST